MPKSCHALPRAGALLISNPNVLRTDKYWNASRPILEILYSSTSLDCSLSPAQKNCRR